ncbi:MAG: tryptophan synthase subunit alpha [Arenicellales bacterium]
MSTRLETLFTRLKTENRPALVTFITAGDPTPDTSFEILSNLATSGADIIELGMPFSDPMADGPAIQLANQRALANGMTLAKTLDQVKKFRQNDTTTPIILMGYFNPIHHMGINAFLDRADEAGVDGLIIVDLPSEEDDELCHPARTQGIDWIRLATPTTDDARLKTILKNGSGFIYYVSIAGVTGTQSAQASDVNDAIKRIRKQTDLPIAVGFGIKTAQDVKKTGEHADAVVVGSAIINIVQQSAEANDSSAETAKKVGAFVSELATGCLTRK